MTTIVHDRQQWARGCEISLLDPLPTMGPQDVAMLQLVYRTGTGSEEQLNTLNVGLPLDTLRTLADGLTQACRAIEARREREG